MVTAPTRPGRTEALADVLTRANTATYHDKISELARAFGVAPPEAITDPEVLAGIRQRALVSAASIPQTQADVAARLIAEHGSGAAAQPSYDAWHAAQAERIVAYEAAAASSRALDDFTARNELDGTEHLEPQDAALDDECAADVALGEVPIGTLAEYPAHVQCPHYVVRTFSAVDDPASLWWGQAPDE